MKQPRFQPLSAIYKDLCTVLYDTVLLLYTTDFAKPEAAQALQKTEATLLLFEYQAAIEEALLFPVIHDYEPVVVAILRDDHHERTQYIQELQKMIRLNANKSETYRSILFSGRLLHLFNDFMACSIGQMRNHESMMNPVFWRYYTDDELQCVAASVREMLASVNTMTYIPAQRKRKSNAVAFKKKKLTTISFL